MATLEKINIALIRPSAMNPRKTFDQSLIEELAQNIAEQGLLQPITIRAIEYTDYLDDGNVISLPSAYEVVCGERRFRAWSLLAENKPEKYAYIPAIVREMNDKEAFDAMITENLQRKDVDPIEEATAISLLMKRGDSTSDIAARLGKSERFVTDRVKLANLIPELGKMLQDGLIPLTGALMLAKLSEDKQHDYYEYNGGDSEDSVSRIKEFVERSFGDLTSSQFYEHDGFDEHLPLCSKCLNNTGNFKCLFYEMKGEKPRCTNRVCMQNKEMQYLLHCIREEAPNLLRQGDKFTPGKTVVIVEDAGSWWTEDEVENRKKFMEGIASIGIAVVDRFECFASKCYYDMDDERTKEILATNKGCRVLSFRRNYGNGFYMEEEVWYLKGDGKLKAASLQSVEVEKINQQIRRNDELKQEHITDTLRKWAADKKEYSEQNSPLSSAEKIVFSVLLLKECGFSFRRDIGMDNEIGSKKDDFSFVGKHSGDMGKWMRGFIAEKIGGSEAVYDKTLQRCQDMLFSDQYPKEYRELVTKYEKEYEKKNDKLQEKLEALKNR